MYDFEGRVKNDWVRIGCRDFMRYLFLETGIDFITKAMQFIAKFNADEETLVIIVDEAQLRKW